MSHLRNIKIKFANATEMKAVRGVLKEFGYPIFHSFASATKEEDYNCVHIEDTVEVAEVGRARHYTYSNGDTFVLSLAEFIELQAKPVKTPAQEELEKLEASAAELNTRIAALKATI